MDIEVTHSQYEKVLSFYFDLFLANHKRDIQPDFEYWKQELDGAGIGWQLQNVVAELAESMENSDKYLKFLLKEKGINLVIVKLNK